MENVLEFLYQGISVLLLSMAAALLFSQFQSLEQMERAAKKNLYDRHVLSCTQVGYGDER